ncbi:MAG: hypothetical protein ABI867_23765 [Kofleriaceae bacterium]
MRAAAVTVTMPLRPALLPLVIVLASHDAWALEPGKHRELAEKACAEVGLPAAFCSRVGKQVYETDYLEWDDLSAHAQRERGQDRCTAADAAATRVDRLARTLAAEAAARELEQAAIDLGRALHTLQDECAHHGMTNEEHSYYSLTQTCTGDKVSPDVQLDALACATTRTRDALVLAAAALRDTSWTGVEGICVDFEGRDVCRPAVLPSPAMACHFLALHADWDGTDSSWNRDVVGGALVHAFAAGLAGEPAARPVCNGDAGAIDPTAPRSPVADTEAGCGLVNVTCLGKTDGDEPIDDTATGGCSTGGAPGFALLPLALALVLPRRRWAAR